MKTKETSTEQAAKWFAAKTYLEQHALSDKYFESRNPSLLTTEQVEEIWRKENPHLILSTKEQAFIELDKLDKLVKDTFGELANKICNNTLQIKSNNCTNKNCVNGVITFDGQTGKVCKKCNPTNQKQYKTFDKSLFKAYINKFSDEDKLKALVILNDSTILTPLRRFNNYCKTTSYPSKSFKVKILKILN